MASRHAISKVIKKEAGCFHVLAAQTLKIASINGLGELDRLENELEDEIRYENRSPAKTTIGRLRRTGQHKLHSKVVLLIVVLLNIVDCLLVMAELTLDFHYVSDRLDKKEKMLSELRTKMGQKYSPRLDDVSTDMKAESHDLLETILQANIVWDPAPSMLQNATRAFASECAHFINDTAESLGSNFSDYATSLLSSDWSSPSQCFQPYLPSAANYSGAKVWNLNEDGRTDEKLTTVAHKLHYCSITILSILVVICLLKIICNGKRFFKSRLQVFDGIVIFISFIIDIVFIEGVTIMAINEFVIILTFLLPWRILRVLNSLVVAVLDKQRLNLKILYTQKKKVSRTLTETNTKLEVMQRHIEVLQGLCSSRGVADRDVRKALGREQSTGNAKNGASNGGLSSMLALGKLAFQAADAFTPMSTSPKVNSSSALASNVSKDNAQAQTSSASAPPTARTNGSTSLPSLQEHGEPVKFSLSIEEKSEKEKSADVVVELPPKQEQDNKKTDLDTVVVDNTQPLNVKALSEKADEIHLNGSGPPRTDGQTHLVDTGSNPMKGTDIVTIDGFDANEHRKASHSLPDLTEEHVYDETGTMVSRL